ncbi:threonine--tRNA ligase, chloroplastic/mitochondrial 2, partial [Tanacetum coccineum]
RYELSGSLHGLLTKPEKAVGDDDIWVKATGALKDALSDKGWAYEIDEGGGAFYGPKIDLKIEDALGRKWQCSIQGCLYVDHYLLVFVKLIKYTHA